MAIEIKKGKQNAPLRAVIYGPEGIGKTTLASLWPSPLFIDVESGTAEMDVARVPKPSSWAMLMKTCEDLANDMQGFKTLVIDTADWAQRLCSEQVCNESGVQSLGDKDYGALYQKVGVQWMRFLDVLTRISAKANIVVLAHSQVVHCSIPEESGTYDRYELKLLNSFKINLAAATKEWASLVLFCSYQTLIVDGKGAGGKRMLYTTHHACWDAKQRTGFNLPEKMEMPKDGLPAELRTLISSSMTTATPPTVTAPVIGPADNADLMPEATAPVFAPAPMAAAPSAAEDTEQARLLGQLKDAMKAAGVTLPELDAELARKGVVPAGTSPRQYNIATLRRVVGNFDKILHNIRNVKPAAVAA